MPPIITLLTDFGLRDAYVGAMKGVILTIAPGTTLVDLSHDIPPQDVTAAAFVLSSAWHFFPQGTIHLAVVDPGVGTSRRPLAVSAQGHYFIAPDNGLLSLVLREEVPFQAVALTNPRYWRIPSPSFTFHGRDVFAPAAAHVARGVPLSALGEPLTDIVRLSWPLPTRLPGGGLRGEIVYIDHFGNAVTNLPGALVEPYHEGWFCAGPFRLRGLSATYADVQRGAPLALIGSHGFLEFAIREGSAAQEGRLQVGTKVEVLLAVA